MIALATALLSTVLAASGDCSDRGTLALESARDARAIANDLHRLRDYYHQGHARGRELQGEPAEGEDATGDRGRWGLTTLGWYDQFLGVPACVDERELKTSLTRGWFGLYAYDDMWHADRWGVEAYFLAAGDALQTGDGREVPFRQRLFGGSFWWSKWIAFSAGLTLDLPPTPTDLSRLTPRPNVRDEGLNLYLSLGVPLVQAFVDVIARPGARQIDLATLSGRDFPLWSERLRGFASVGYVTREDKAILTSGVRLQQWGSADVSFEGLPAGVRSASLRFEPQLVPSEQERMRHVIAPFVEASILGAAYFRQTTGASWTPGVRGGVAYALDSGGATVGAEMHLGLNGHEELARVPALFGAFQWGFRLSLSLRLGD